VGKPRVTGVLLAPQARQALRLRPEELANGGRGATP